MKVVEGKTLLMGIKSSNVHSLEYNAQTKELKAQLRTGTYLYKGIDKETMKSLEVAYMNGESVGKEFNRLIVKGGFKYEKLG